MVDDDAKTPERPNNEDLMKLLKNLEGLTPEGLEHLIETQKRADVQAGKFREKEALTD